jgi:2-polyprenyl-3-methyl-5-hydroxy-6-metoxy-1,4-benzoquinol methylase
MKQEVIQSEYWDRNAKRISDMNSQMSEIAKQEIENFFAFIGIKSNSNILEIGCGSGRFTIPLLRKGHQVTGTEVSIKNLEELRHFAENEKLDSKLILKETSFEEPFLENKFDLAILGNVMHHFNPIKKQQILENIIKSLKPGGQIVIFEPNALFPFYLPYYLFFEWSGLQKGIWAAEKGLFKSTSHSISGLLGKVGIINIQLKRHTIIPLRLERFLPGLNKINCFLERVPIINNFSAYLWLKGYRS